MPEGEDLEAVLAEIASRLESDREFDLESYLMGHPAQETLREKIAQLRELGLIPSPERPDLGRSIPPPNLFAGFEERYEILGSLGTGAMGRVMRARDGSLGREIAVKFLDPPAALGGGLLQQWQQRFLREARLAASLQHPGIAPVHDVGVTQDGRLFFTMRLVDGRSLDQLLAEHEAGREPLTLFGRVEIVLRVCQAIGHAHGVGILHRDIKPSNVMIRPQGEVLVLDWGLARRAEEFEPAGVGAPSADERGPSVRTESGTIVGTPSYLAPEQARGERADARSDVFGIGAVLCQVLTGEPPFRGKDREDVLERARAGRLDDAQFQANATRIPRALVAICKRALAAKPAERYPDAAALSADLQAFLEDRQGSAWRDPLPTRFARLVRRHPVPATALVSLLVILSLAVALANKVVEAKEEARRGLDTRIALELPRVRDLGAQHALTSENIDYASWCREYLAKFRELDLDLERPDSGQRLSELLLRLDARSPNAAQALRDALYDLGDKLMRAGALFAWMQTQGAEITRHPTDLWKRIFKRSEALPASDPGLIELWPRLSALVTIIEEDPWRRELFEAWVAWWSRREDHLGDLIDRSAARSGDDLVRLALLVRGARGADAAITVLQHAVSQSPSCYSAHFELGSMYGQRTDDRDELQRAVEQFLAAVALNPDAAWAHNNLGKALVDQAILAKDEAKTLPETARAVRMKTHDELVRRAEESYRRALEINPRIGSAHSNLANLIAGPRDEEAEQHLRAALEAEPCHYPALVSYAAFLERLRRPVEALVLRERLRKCIPDNPVFQADVATLNHDLGSTELARGDRDEGVRYLEAAVTAYQDALALDPNLYNEQNLGIALVELGRLEEGLDWLEKSIAAREEDLESRTPRLPTTEHRERLEELRASAALEKAADDLTSAERERVRGLLDWAAVVLEASGR